MTEIEKAAADYERAGEQLCVAQINDFNGPEHHQAWEDYVAAQERFLKLDAAIVTQQKRDLGIQLADISNVEVM